MRHKDEKFIFLYSSSYHGYYIEDLLRRNGIASSLRKAPRAIGKSCNTAIYIQELDFEKAVHVIDQTKIKPQAIYEIMVTDKLDIYKKIV